MASLAAITGGTRIAAVKAIVRIGLAVGAAGTAFVRSVPAAMDLGGAGSVVADRLGILEFRK